MSFSKRISRLTARYQERANDVFRQSVQDVVEEAQTPVAKGGRMRVDTGFLRASGGAQLNRMPSGPTSGLAPAAGTTGEALAAVLANWKAGDVVFWGWSANYARPREYKDGFVRGAAEKWKRIVDSNGQKARRSR